MRNGRRETANRRPLDVPRGQLFHDPIALASPCSRVAYRPLRNQRGQAMAGIGFGFLAFLALTAVAVDVGHLALRATEVQTSADAGATAGARRLFKSFNDGAARETAKLDA